MSKIRKSSEAQMGSMDMAILEIYVTVQNYDLVLMTRARVLVSGVMSQ